MESKLRYLYRFKIHPYYSFSFKKKFTHTEIDMSFGELKKAEKQIIFQLISEKNALSEEVEIYTDGLKSIVEEGNNLVGCAIFVLQFILMSYSYKLNPWTSSFMAEAYALDKAIDLIRIYSRPQTNICMDSLSLLQTLKNSELSLFLSALNKLNLVIQELNYKISRFIMNNVLVRLT